MKTLTTLPTRSSSKPCCSPLVSRKIRLIVSWFLIVTLLSLATVFYLSPPPDTIADAIHSPRIVADIAKSDRPPKLLIVPDALNINDRVNKMQETPPLLNVDPIDTKNGNELVSVLQDMSLYANDQNNA